MVRGVGSMGPRMKNPPCERLDDGARQAVARAMEAGHGS